MRLIGVRLRGIIGILLVNEAQILMSKLNRSLVLSKRDEPGHPVAWAIVHVNI